MASPEPSRLPAEAGHIGWARAVTRMPRLRRRWIVLVAVLIMALAYVRLADASYAVYQYRVVDDHTFQISSVTGPWTWTRVTGVTETTSSVIVSVNSISFQFAPGFGDDIVWLVVTLRDPIGDRTVIDASSGLPVPRT
jgi:hypothetical protein